MIRIPPKVRQDAPIKAADYNALRDALVAMEKEMRGLRVRGGPGILARHSPSGIALRVARQPNLPKNGPPRFSPLKVARIPGEEVKFSVVVGFGVIVEINPRGPDPEALSSAPDAVMFHIPLIQPIAPTGGDPPAKIPLDGETEIVIGSGDTVFVRYQTKDDGSIELEPEEGQEDKRPFISADPAPSKSTHYQPPNPDEEEGTKGDYYVKLFKISENAETKAVEIEYFCQSDIFHYHEVWRGENLGEGAGPFKKRDAADDVYQFRGHKGRSGHKTEEAGDDINHDFWGENQGTGVAVFMFDPEAPVVDGPSKWRTLRGLSSSEASDEGITPQLRVEVKNEPGEELPDPLAKNVLFRGNGKKGSRVFLQCDETTEIARIEWADGFVTSEGDLNIIVGECPGSSTEPPPP